MDPFRRGPSLRQVVVSYAPDWIISFALWSIFYYIAHHVTGFKRHFSLTDTSLQHPHAAYQRVSSNALWLLGAGLPLAMQLFVNLVLVHSWWDVHHSTLGLLLSITLTTSITQIVKVTVGRPRPDLVARCQPMANSEDPPWGLSSIDICLQTSAHILEDSWRSFPSGHSSLAFAGLGFLTFYLAGKLYLFDGRGHAAKVWLSLVPLGLASWVAITRTMDYRHHWEDVVAGSALGLGIAYFSYRQYYPHLGSKRAHIPFTTRFEEAEVEYDVGGGRDDEETVGLIGQQVPDNQGE